MDLEFRIAETDHQGNPVPCNCEDALTPLQQSLAAWHIITLANGRSLENLSFLRNLLLTLPTYKSSVLRGKANTLEMKRAFDQRFGAVYNFALRPAFTEVGERLTLYKLCRFAASRATCPHDERRTLLSHLCRELDLRNDPRCLLVAAAVEKVVHNRSVSPNANSVAPIIALTMKILLADDRQFDPLERHTVRQMMIALGVRGGSVPDFKPDLTLPVEDIVAKIAVDDHDLALLLMIEMAILDQRVSGKEKELIQDALGAMDLDQEKISRAQERIELDTGVKVRLGKTVTIDYQEFTDR